jgi:bifunctional UDP-N-acetylglucosamine pyrophosphorylase/glucosamine-1-phosphate N-acetyltransferase
MHIFLSRNPHTHERDLMDMFKTVAVILAAGQGKRMQSDLPKVLHPVAGRPMVIYSIEAAMAATGEKPVLVVGHKAECVRKEVGEIVHYVLQEKQLGTGHAVQQTESLLKNQCDFLLVISADMPLLMSETLRNLVEIQQTRSGPLTILTAISDNPRGFGRVIRNGDHQVQAIVEEAVASPEQLAVRELNAGLYCFSAEWLWESLKKIQVSPKGEYYLTDLVEIAVNSGLSVRAVTVDDPEEILGVNTQEHLAEAELLMNKRMFQFH